MLGFASKHGGWIGAAVLAVGLGLGGCNGEDDALGAGGSDGSGGSDDGEAQLLDERVAAFAAARCEQMTDCECAGVDDLDGCVEQNEALWASRFVAADERGLQVDEACIQDNLASLETAACRWPSTVYAGEHLCDRFCNVFYGDRQLGQACEAYDAVVSNCAPGLMCSDGACVDPCGPLSGLSVGQYCLDEASGPFEDCATGTYCDWQTSTCQPYATAGQSCTEVQCGPDLWCDWMTNTCLASAGSGQSCDDRPCAAGLFCNWNGGPTSVCQAPALAGQSCDSRPCAEGLVCGSGQICGDPPPAGQPCAQSGQCAEGALCDWDITLCRARPSLGQPCLFGECADGLWCEQTMEDPAGTCVAARENWLACTGHSQCESKYCPRGYCEPRPGLGEDCENVFVCQAGLVCNGKTCQPTDYRGPAACVYDGW